MTRWTLIDDHAFLAPATEYRLPVDGDADRAYLIAIRQHSDSAWPLGEISLCPNNDRDVTHYGCHTHFGYGAQMSSNRGTTWDLIATNEVAPQEQGVALCYFEARSGWPRTWLSQSVRGINGTHINRIGRYPGVWTPTEPITELAYITGDDSADSFGVGTRILTFAQRETGDGMELVERIEIAGSPVNSVTFSNLQGNADALYQLRYRIVSGSQHNPAYVCRPNGSTGPYGYQYLEATGAAQSANRGTDVSGFPCGYVVQMGQITCGELTIWPSAGLSRVALGQELQSVGGTHIGSVAQYGSVWNNATDAIEALVVTSYNQPANCLGVGSVLELWKA